MTHDDSYQQSADFFHLKQYGDAIDAARSGLNLDPDDGRLWQVLGAALWFVGKTAGAMAALETASALIPLKPLGERILAECYANVGKPKLAVCIYRHLVRSGRCPSELLPGIAASLNRLRQYKLALQACRILTRRHPDNHQAHFGTAFYLNRLGASPRLMLGPLARAMKSAPHLLHYRLNLAFVWTELGNDVIASQLLVSVKPDAIFCPAWLRKMQAIFESGGDTLRADACVRQLDRLERGRCPSD